MKVMVNSLPKSGTHLINKLLEFQGYEFSGVNFSSTNVHGRYKYAKRILRGCTPFSMAIDVGLDVPSMVRKQWVVNGIKKIKYNQYMGGHFPYSDQLKVLLDDSDIKIIYMMRDPRDVILSWAHYVPKVDWHYGKEGFAGKTLEERIALLLSGYRSGNYQIEGFLNILRKVEGWISSKDILLIRFEDLVGPSGGGTIENQKACIDRLSNFLGESINETGFSEGLYGGTKTFRKGQIGSWRDEMSDSIKSQVDYQLNDILARIGYE